MEVGKFTLATQRFWTLWDPTVPTILLRTTSNYYLIKKYTLIYKEVTIIKGKSERGRGKGIREEKANFEKLWTSSINKRHNK